MTMTETEWTVVVRAWRASRQSAREFARTRVFTDSALRYWALRLERQGVPTKASVSAQPRVGTATPVGVSSLARVVRPGELPAGATDAALLVHVGKVSVAVRRGFDPVLLRDVLRALGEAG
jgi:hypothetical protein